MRRKKMIGVSLLSVMILSGCASKNSVTKERQTAYFSQQIESQRVTKERIAPPKIIKKIGIASWYGEKFQGRETASGEIFDMNELTAAHRTLPFGTRVRVTDMVTDRSVVVRINDRGPFVANRIIDLSYAAAKELGLIQRGTTDVRLDLVDSEESGDVADNAVVGCVGNSCMASIAKKSSNNDNIQEIASVQKDEIQNQEDLYFVSDSSNIEYDYSASPFARDHLEWIDSDPYSPKKHSLIEISSKISVQVGAFRRYAGAKVYAKRYSLLTDQYRVKIKKEFKDALPIYRVRLYGFSSEREARRFIRQYGIDGAFLVRR
jgi:rare lipoprotein A